MCSINLIEPNQFSFVFAHVVSWYLLQEVNTLPDEELSDTLRFEVDLE